MKPFDPYALVVAVNHLTDVVNQASQPNLFKDYFMPIFVVMLSAITAYVIAIWGYKFQDAAKNERMKADTLNSIVLKMQTMQASLIATKKNYFENLGSNPIQRALSIPIMPLNLEHTSFAANELAQLIYTKNNDIEKKPWLNFATYVSTFNNFNLFVDILNLRNESVNEVHRQLAPLITGSGAKGEISIKDAYNLLDDATRIKYIDLSEDLITLVDDLLETLNDFMINFPLQTKGIVNKNYLKNYVVISGYENKSLIFLKLLERSPSVDLQQLGHFMKMTEEEAKSRYVDNSAVITTPKL